MYLVAEGMIMLSMKNAVGEYQVVDGLHGTVQVGGYFGELALLNNNPRVWNAYTCSEKAYARARDSAY